MANARTPSPAKADTGPPLCGPPLPWDCSIFERVTDRDGPDPAALLAPVTEGSALLPPFVALVDVSPTLGAPELNEPPWVPGVLVLAALVLLLVVRRWRKGRRSGPR